MRQQSRCIHSPQPADGGALCIQPRNAGSNIAQVIVRVDPGRVEQAIEETKCYVFSRAKMKRFKKFYLFRCNMQPTHSSCKQTNRHTHLRGTASLISSRRAGTNAPVSSSTWPKQDDPISTARTPHTMYSAAVSACAIGGLRNNAGNKSEGAILPFSPPPPPASEAHAPTPTPLHTHTHTVYQSPMHNSKYHTTHAHMVSQHLQPSIPVPGTAQEAHVAGSVLHQHTRHGPRGAQQWAHRRGAVGQPAAQFGCVGLMIGGDYMYGRSAEGRGGEEGAQQRDGGRDRL